MIITIMNRFVKCTVIDREFVSGDTGADVLITTGATQVHTGTPGPHRQRRGVCVCVRVCSALCSVLLLWIPLLFSKGGRGRRIMGGPQKDPLEMETPLQKTLSLHKMEGGEDGESMEG